MTDWDEEIYDWSFPRGPMPLFDFNLVLMIMLFIYMYNKKKSNCRSQTSETRLIEKSFKGAYVV